MTETFTPARAPTIGGSVEVSGRVLSAKFGDGYVQESPDGLNPVGQTWQVSWTNTLTFAEMDEIDTFFRTNLAKPFYYTLPGENSAKKWRCQKWTKIYDQAPLYYGITTSLTQDFTL